MDLRTKLSVMFQKAPLVYGLVCLSLIPLYALIYALLPEGHLDLGEYGSKTVSALYFSVVTITTLGYGGILPKTDVAMLLAASESVFGILFIGLFLNAIATKRDQTSLLAERMEQREGAKRNLLNALTWLVCMSQVPLSGENSQLLTRSDYEKIQSEIDKTGKLEVLSPVLLRRYVGDHLDIIVSMAPEAARIDSTHFASWMAIVADLKAILSERNDIQAYTTYRDFLSCVISFQDLEIFASSALSRRSS